MKLYDRNGDKLTVYNLTAKDEDLTQYRLTKMEQIPKKDRFFKAEPHLAPYGNTLLFEYYTNEDNKGKVIKATEADSRKSSDLYGRYYHILKKAKTNKKLLSDYYSGYLVSRNVVRIQYLDMMKYFLLSEEYRYLGEYDDGKIYKMRGIMQIPESLYLLQLIEQERFENLDKKDIIEQLEFYWLSKISEFNMDELKKMDEFGVANGAYQKAIHKSKTDKHILNILTK